MKIETDRLILRDFVQDDFEAVHEYASDPEVIRYMVFGPNTLEESHAFMARVIAYQQDDPRRNFEVAVTLKNGALIGGCGIRNVSKIEASMGYIFNKKYWGNGYATETAKALVKFGFSEMGVHRIHATCDPRNIASKRVLEKAGMTLEGKLRENILQHGEYRDSLMLSILEHEWNQQTS